MVAVTSSSFHAFIIIYTVGFYVGSWSMIACGEGCNFERLQYNIQSQTNKDA